MFMWYPTNLLLGHPINLHVAMLHEVMMPSLLMSVDTHMNAIPCFLSLLHILYFEFSFMIWSADFLDMSECAWLENCVGAKVQHRARRSAIF